MQTSEPASSIQLLGSAAFGAMIGWYVYYINRYRRGDVQLGDIVTLIGVLGGGSVLALFPAKSDMFGAYGIGLFVGFFGYLVVVSLQVRQSDNFNVDWFLDGRRKRPEPPWEVPADWRASTSAMQSHGAPPENR